MNECVHVKKTEVKAASVIKSLTLFFIRLPPKTCPSSLCNSCWFWEGLDLFKLKGKQHEGSLMWRSGGGAERRGGGLEAAPRRRSRSWSWSQLGTGGKPCKPPCRGSSLPGPEVARSPALICTYPYTGSCRCKGSRGGLIGHSEKGRREMTA